MNWLIATMLVLQQGTSPAPPASDALFQVTEHDYPAEARDKRESGTVEARVMVAETGSVSDCSVTKSSGSPSLDRRTCEVLKLRGAYVPARDAKGKPISNVRTQRVSWSLPVDPIWANARLKGEVTVAYARSGDVESCTVSRSSGDRKTDANICNVILRDAEPKPRRSKDGRRMAHREVVPFAVQD